MSPAKPLSLSPPSTPPHKNSALLPNPPLRRSACSLSSTQNPPPAEPPLLSRSSSLHAAPARPLLASAPVSRSSTLSSSSSAASAASAASSCTNSLAFPPTPPQSTHNTPLVERHRSALALDARRPPTPPRSSSRNDIFALTLPQPTLPLPSAPKTIQHPPITPPAHSPQDLIRLKTTLHLTISTAPAAVLGQGTHGTVHLALLSTSIPRGQPKPWKLCAAKLSEDIPGSIKETLVFERLRAREQDTPAAEPENGSRFILGWLGLKDHKECSWTRHTDDSARQQRKPCPSQEALPPIVLALEYCAGGDLFKFVQRAALLRPSGPSESRRLEVGRLRWLRWARELAEALDWCKERHVLVGDLKPQNVLLTGDLHIKLSDFNRSTILSLEQSQGGLGLTDPQGTGTSVYAAPELVQPPPSPCSYPADIFALGITLHFLLTGREPYRGIQSAVERMLLISRGAFWEHELGMRWKRLDDGQRAAQKHPKQPLRANSTDPQQIQDSVLLVSQNTIEALYAFKPDPEPAASARHAVLAAEEDCPAADSEARIGFYSDGSPELRFLNGNDVVDERVLKLISKMCSPAACDRPHIGQVIQQLKAL